MLASASIGSGHMQAAKAIETAWREAFPADEVIVADSMDGGSSYVQHVLKETYLKMIAVTPFLYDTLYHLSQGLSPGSRGQSLFSWFMQKTMQQLYSRHQPDLVICTHPFPCAAMAYLKRHHRISAPLAGVITDFAVHGTWIYPETDLYTVAADELKAELVGRGIAADRIDACGTPVQPPLPPAAADYQKLGLQPGLPVVMLMGGGLGLGPLREVLLALDSVAVPLQIAAVAGNNSGLQQELSAAAAGLRHQTTVFGYTPYVRELMQAAALLITKPGALTISEALAAGLPMLLFQSFPGQETDNAAFLLERGAAGWFEPDGAEQIVRLLTDSGERRQALAAINRIARPASAKAAVAAIAARLLPAGQAAGM